MSDVLVLMMFGLRIGLFFYSFGMGLSLFDWVAEAGGGEVGYWEDRERFNRLYELSKLCGHCDKWMKCICPREKHGRKPLCNTPGCSQFILRARD